MHNRLKILNLSLIVTSLFGYLEWGNGKHAFLFEAEAELFSKIVTDPMSIIHPLTVLPLLGQILLLVTLFQKRPSRFLTVTAIIGLGLLIGLMFVVGVLELSYKIILSTTPFLVVAFMTIREHRKAITRTPSGHQLN